MSEKSQRGRIFLLIIILVSLSVYFFHNSITLFPSFIHAWTQSDRYALALGFLNNGFDFFHPQTYNLVTSEGITRVDFPIHEYLVALIMKLTGINEPVIFRLYTLLFAITGLLFLFRLSSLFNRSFPVSLLVVLFLFFCPVFLYYANGFIPSIPSLANLFIAYFFYFHYKKEGRKSDFLLAVIFLTLAALARLPFFIFLFAVFCQQCLGYLISKKAERKELIAFLVSFLIFGGYQIYNYWLGKKYGTQFLVSILPPANKQQLLEWLRETWNHWRYEYFTVPQYLLIATLIIVSSIQIFNNRESLHRFKDLFLQIGIAGTGSIIFFFLMLMQFPDHDYYFIDYFYPLSSLFMIYLTGYEIKSKFLNSGLGIILSGLVILSFVRADETNQKRYETGAWDRVEISRINFTGSGKFLDSIGVDKNAKVLVLDGYTTNVPLILMNRKGWTVNWTTNKNIVEGLSRPFDLVAIQNAFGVSDVIKNAPEIITQLEKFADNGLISFYHKKTIPDQSLHGFLGIDSLNTIFTVSGTDSVIMDNNTEFFALVPDSLRTLPAGGAVKILVTGKILRNISSPQLIASAGTNGPASSYFSFNLNDYTMGAGQWENVLFQFAIPLPDKENVDLKVYFWNDQKGHFLLSDLKVICYR